MFFLKKIHLVIIFDKEMINYRMIAFLLIICQLYRFPSITIMCSKKLYLLKSDNNITVRAMETWRPLVYLKKSNYLVSQVAFWYNRDAHNLQI
jgi:hypothetical protein